MTACFNPLAGIFVCDCGARSGNAGRPHVSIPLRGFLFATVSKWGSTSIRLSSFNPLAGIFVCDPGLVDLQL